MGKSIKNINEEINRIKSLFTEERMYGNLVTEDYSLDDIQTNRDELIKILGEWETYNENRTGLGSKKIKPAIRSEIDSAQEVINNIDIKDSCSTDTINLINKKLKSLEEKKSSLEYKALSKEDKTFLNSVVLKLNKQKTICEEMGSSMGGSTANDNEPETDNSNNNEPETNNSNNNEPEPTAPTTVEIFKDKGGKYHYAKLPNGTYWYSTDGSNWKQQKTQKGMDAIEERINSSKVDSLGSVEASSIDSSYTKPENIEGGDDANDSSNDVIKPNEEENGDGGDDEEDTIWDKPYDEILKVNNDEGDDILFYDIWYKNPTDETIIKKREDIDDFESVDWEPVGGTRISFDILRSMFSEKNSKTPTKSMKIMDDNGELVDNDGKMFYVPVDSDGVSAITTVGEKRKDDRADKGEFKKKFSGPGGCRENMGKYIKLVKDGITMEDAFGDKEDDARGYIEWCLGNYHSKLEKIGLFKKGKGVYLLKKQWGIEYEKPDGGIIGQKYEIIVNGRSRGKIKKVGESEYRVISKPEEKIFGRNKQFRDGFEDAVNKAIELPENEELTVAGIIQKGPIQWAKLLSRVV